MASHQWHKNLKVENPFRHVSEHDPSEVDSLAIQVTTIHSLTLAITRDKSLLCVDPRNMASFATIAAVQPYSAVKGLGGSSLSGAKLFIKPSRQSFKPKSIRYIKSLFIWNLGLRLMRMFLLGLGLVPWWPSMETKVFTLI